MIMKKFVVRISIFFPLILFSQIKEKEEPKEYIIIEGDSIVNKTMSLDPVYILNNIKFNNKKEKIRYLILRRKTLKVYPYAKLAAERLDSLNIELQSIKKKRAKKQHIKKIQKYIEGEFSDELKKLSRTEGQILVKLLYRQTGKTTFNIVKELRSGWRAFWYSTTAKMFDISLKTAYDPKNVYEDYLIEDILQRSFKNDKLIRQKGVVEYDFYDLRDIWANKKK